MDGAKITGRRPPTGCNGSAERQLCTDVAWHADGQPTSRKLCSANRNSAMRAAKHARMRDELRNGYYVLGY